MPYEKQMFVNGKVLKAEQLNAMDDQIAANADAVEEVKAALPEITAEDEGKALVVKNGRLELAEITASDPTTPYTGEVEVV